MATEIVPAPARAENQGMSLADRLAHEAGSYVRRAPLPLAVVRAVAQYEAATARYDELDARPASDLSSAEFDAFQGAQQTIAEAFGVLAAHGRLDLIAPAEAASRYRRTFAHCRDLSVSCSAEASVDPAAVDFDALFEAQDEMGHRRHQLAKAKRLDLIGGA
ncbi:hypothetical protein ACFWPQ_01895 [Streptomyces sp. NPDC058464]|uniref:hypothetical protein n=1 Tax=Streptomyces sp. NPDC058464 TaxID=3346511 RepID=UPI00364F5C71